MYCTTLKQILDAGKGESAASPSLATQAGRSGALIAHVTLGESDLRFVETGPPCKVLELPLELPTASTVVTGRGRRRAHAQGLHPPSIVLFLERPSREYLEKSPRAPSPIATTATSTTTAAIHDGAAVPSPSGRGNEDQTVETISKRSSEVVVDELSLIHI